MRPKVHRESGEHDLFRSRLDPIIDMDHALVKLAGSIDWRSLEQRLGAVYTDKPGRPIDVIRSAAVFGVLLWFYTQGVVAM
jgi:transposase, IS5 family